jgi:hypothetical protein
VDYSASSFGASAREWRDRLENTKVPASREVFLDSDFIALLTSLANLCQASVAGAIGSNQLLNQ